MHCYESCEEVQEKKLVITYQITLWTLMNMAIMYKVGLKDYPKAEEMLRRELSGHSLVDTNAHSLRSTRTPACIPGTYSPCSREMGKLDERAELEKIYLKLKL